MKIEKLHIGNSYYRHSLEIKFSLSTNYLQEITSDIDVLEEVIINSIHDIYRHVCSEIATFINHYLQSLRSTFIQTKNYLFKISMDDKQKHAMISFVEI